MRVRAKFEQSFGCEPFVQPKQLIKYFARLFLKVIKLFIMKSFNWENSVYDTVNTHSAIGSLYETSCDGQQPAMKQ